MDLLIVSDKHRCFLNEHYSMQKGFYVLSVKSLICHSEFSIQLKVFDSEIHLFVFYTETL